MSKTRRHQNPFKTILWCGLLVGTLDILAAFANTYISFDKGPTFVLQYVATAIYGKSAFTGGTDIVLAGLALHYCIAYFFTALFFLIYTEIGIPTSNKILPGVIYGIFIWLVMNLLVVPLSQVPAGHIHAPQAIINALILIVMIGVPLSIIASDFYSKKPTH
jgi:hypothetical protein